MMHMAIVMPSCIVILVSLLFMSCVSFFRRLLVKRTGTCCLHKSRKIFGRSQC